MQIGFLGPGTSPGGGHGILLQYCLESPMHRGAWEGYSPYVCKEPDDQIT